nr:integrase, catalytic region, zinc finger, CCHC-type, peptidase aspartic, catalytic [Tanacetum cinerariifolium]
MAQSSNVVCLRTCLEPDEWIKDSGCSKHMTGNSLFSTYKAYDGGNVVFRSNLKGKIICKGTVRSSSKLARDQTSNPTSSTNPTPKGQIRRSSKKKVENSHFKEHLTPVATKTDNRTIAEMLRAPTEGVLPPVATLFQNTGITFKVTFQQPHATTIRVRNSRSKLIASPVNACDNHSSSELAKLTHAVNQQTSAVTTAMTAMLKQFQSPPPPAQVKAVEEICVTYGGAHPYYQCLAGSGNTFPEYRDNIQGYVSAATGNFNQGNPGYCPQGVANQMRPPGFTQPNVQNN